MAHVEVLVVIFGLLIGSFVNVLIYRIPRNINFVITRSKCESCGHLIYWYYNIPLISFIFLRGVSRCCGSKISWKHPFIEILFSVASYFLFPKDNLNWQSLIHFVFFISIFSALLAHFFIDIDFQILPDEINLYLLILFLIYSVIFNSWTFWFFGGIIGFGVPYGITWLFYQLRGKIGMGGGDIKLYGVLGVYLGPQQIILTIFLSCFLGSFVGLFMILLKRLSQEEPIPFGPFIVIAAMFQIFFPQFQRLLLSTLFG